MVECWRVESRIEKSLRHSTKLVAGLNDFNGQAYIRVGENIKVSLHQLGIQMREEWLYSTLYTGP